MPFALIVWLAGSVGAVAAEEQVAVAGDPQALSAVARPRLDIRARSLALKELVGATQATQRASSRDTLKNGAIIGAVAGALSAGAFGALICHLYQEDGGASCWPDALRGAAIGAAIGTGTGLAVDAALTRRPGVAVRIGVAF